MTILQDVRKEADLRERIRELAALNDRQAENITVFQSRIQKAQEILSQWINEDPLECENRAYIHDVVNRALKALEGK